MRLSSVKSALYRALRNITQIPNKIVNVLYMSVDRIYELSGYRINREFYRKFTLYSINTIFLLLIVFFLTMPLALHGVLLFIAMSISISVALFILLMSIAMLYINALMIVYRRRVHFEEKLIHTLSNMVPLVATRASLTEVFSRLYYFERDPEIKHELYLILKDCALGMDIVTALRRSIDRVPSPVYRDVISSFVEALKVSQCPVDVLIEKLNILFERKRLTLRRVVTELTLFFQAYVILGLLAPAVVTTMYIPMQVLSVASKAIPGLGRFTFTPPIADITGIQIIFAAVWAPLVSLLFYLIFDSILSKL